MIEDIWRGVEKLDAYFEDEIWSANINLDELQIESRYYCTLSQLFGSYEEGLRLLEITLEEAHLYGFDASPNIDRYEQDQEYYDLTILWKRKIQQIREEYALVRTPA